jgi:hypothetical protein
MDFQTQLATLKWLLIVSLNKIEDALECGKPCPRSKSLVEEVGILTRSANTVSEVISSTMKVE